MFSNVKYQLRITLHMMISLDLILKISFPILLIRVMVPDVFKTLCSWLKRKSSSSTVHLRLTQCGPHCWHNEERNRFRLIFVADLSWYVNDTKHTVDSKKQKEQNESELQTMDRRCLLCFRLCLHRCQAHYRCLHADWLISHSNKLCVPPTPLGYQQQKRGFY